MIESLGNYVLSLTDAIPRPVYIALVGILSIGLAVFLFKCGIKQGLRWFMGLVLMEYVFILLCTTLLIRTYSENHGYDFSPFWSYEAIIEGRHELIAENIMNVLVFIPVGLLLGFVVPGMNWRRVFLIGGSISVAIEALQFVMKRGFSEVDDMMHNTLGCMMGFGLYKVISYIMVSFRRRRTVG